MIFDREDIIEYRTTWNNELFFKNKSSCLAAKRLIKKSIFIVQTRLCRQLKYTENDLTNELKAVENERQLLNNYRHSSSLAEGLQERLKVLQNEIDNYNLQIKNVVKQEKEYWKQLQQIIEKRANFQESAPSNKQPIVNATFNLPNDENLPPSPVKVPKIRKKKKIVS